MLGKNCGVWCETLCLLSEHDTELSLRETCIAESTVTSDVYTTASTEHINLQYESSLSVKLRHVSFLIHEYSIIFYSLLDSVLS